MVVGPGTQGDEVAALDAVEEAGVGRHVGQVDVVGLCRVPDPVVCRYLRSLHRLELRIAIVMDNFSLHLSTKKEH